MKKLMLGLSLLAVCLVYGGCASVPQFANLTGQWKYTFTETGKKAVETGSMTLKQDCFKLSGQANDSYGEFVLAGTVEGPDFVINGTRNDAKRSFKLSATLEDENTFSGTFTTDQRTSGKLSGQRVISK